MIDYLKHSQTKKVYIKKDLKQIIKKKKGGYTQVEFLEFEKNEDIVKVYLNKIIEKIKISMKSEFDYRDIAVLVRKNVEARDISVKFLEESIPHFVSDAVFLKDSDQVQFWLI